MDKKAEGRVSLDHSQASSFQLDCNGSHQRAWAEVVSDDSLHWKEIISSHLSRTVRSRRLGVRKSRNKVKIGTTMGFPSGSAVTNLPADSGEPDSTPGLGRSHAEGNGKTLQHSCLGNPMDRGAWWATVHGVAVS